MAQQDSYSQIYGITGWDTFSKTLGTYDPETVRKAAGCMEVMWFPLSHSRRAMLAFRSSAS